MKDRLWRKDREGNTEGDIVKGRLKDRLRVKDWKRKIAEMYRIIFWPFSPIVAQTKKRVTNDPMDQLTDRPTDLRTYPPVVQYKHRYVPNLNKDGTGHWSQNHLPAVTLYRLVYCALYRLSRFQTSSNMGRVIVPWHKISSRLSAHITACIAPCIAFCIASCVASCLALYHFFYCLL